MSLPVDTNKVTTHIPGQGVSAEETTSGNTTTIEQAVTEAPSEEQTAATREMFFNGVKNGGAASPRALEEAPNVPQEKAAESKEAPTVETQAITSAEPTEEELNQKITDLQKSILNGVMTNIQNVIMTVNLVNGDEDDRKLFLDKVNLEISGLNLNPDEQLLLKHLTDVITPITIEGWSNAFAQFFPNKEDLTTALINGVVHNSLSGNIKELMTAHNEINPQYIENVRKCQSKKEVLTNVGTFVFNIIQLPIDDVKRLNNLLNPNNKETDPTEDIQGLSGPGRQIFDDITAYYNTLSEEDRLGASEGILAGMKEHLKKG